MLISSIVWLVGENKPLSLGCYFWEEEPFFRTCHFSLFSVEPLYKNVHIDHRIIFTLKINCENHGKTQVDFWFVGFSLIWDFSVYFNYLSRITFGGWGTNSRSLKCLKVRQNWFRATPIQIGISWKTKKLNFVVSCCLIGRLGWTRADLTLPIAITIYRFLLSCDCCLFLGKCVLNIDIARNGRKWRHMVDQYNRSPNTNRVY